MRCFDARIGWQVDDNGEPWPPMSAHSWPDHPTDGGHRYDGGCAWCRTGDQPAARDAIAAAIRTEILEDQSKSFTDALREMFASIPRREGPIQMPEGVHRFLWSDAEREGHNKWLVDIDIRPMAGLDRAGADRALSAAITAKLNGRKWEIQGHEWSVALDRIVTQEANP